MAIPLNDFSITVIGDPYKYDTALQTAYETTVANAIIRGRIAATAIGKLVLARINKGPGDVEIYPRYKTGLNAEAVYKMKDKGIGRDPHKIVIWFTPQQWKVELAAAQAAIPADLRAFEPGMLQDEVLLHELVHAGRLLDGFAQVNQTLEPDPDAPAMYANDENAPYENVEEFMTILVSNIYLSEKGQKALRASHGNRKYASILAPAQSTSESFLEKANNRALVKLYCETDRLAPQLATVDVPFNPVKAYFAKNPMAYIMNRSLT